MNNIVTLFLLTTIFCGCSSMTQRGALNRAYSNYKDKNYEDVIEITSRAESYIEPSKEMKAEIVFLKALALEKLERRDEAIGLFKYLSDELGDTQYGYKANEKISLFINMGHTTNQRSSIFYEVTEDKYAKSKETKGVVVLAVDWNRHRNCGGYEYAEITNIGFDSLPMKNIDKDIQSEIIFNRPYRLTNKAKLINYALLLEPGEYGFTSFNIKAAEVGHFISKRNGFFIDGKHRGASFNLKAGEVVYIGNYSLDCTQMQKPTLFRNYTDDRVAFHKHMAEVTLKYPFINPNSVIFRLFPAPLGGEIDLPK